MGQNNGKPVVFTDQGASVPASLSSRLPLAHPGLANSASPVNLNHFRLLRVVGKGAFGKVRIVERKDTGLTFALKYIRKDEGQWQICPPRPQQKREALATHECCHPLCARDADVV